MYRLNIRSGLVREPHSALLIAFSLDWDSCNSLAQSLAWAVNVSQQFEMFSEFLSRSPTVTHFIWNLVHWPHALNLFCPRMWFFSMGGLITCGRMKGWLHHCWWLITHQLLLLYARYYISADHLSTSEMWTEQHHQPAYSASNMSWKWMIQEVS